ncbi:ZIP family metal transporter [Desertivirga xinjiangensis]|uniref:ZIP family metal transporter n=1 Tax=Desertivirga xinjiangensis TaxID=539206 RepID=UPI00210C1E9B|nr:ZIP family metal transporter [Pedobacter xinjiangensis]
MEFWPIVILFSSCFLGGLSVFFFKKDSSQRLKLILSFSGAYLFSITILHLIPEVYQHAGHDHSIGLFVLGGFLFQILLEQFSQGIEHGHIHKHSHDQPTFPYGIMLSLCLHAFLEGMPLAKGYQNELLFGIALHHIPAAFALGSVLLQNHLRKANIILLLVLFSVMSPAGYLLSNGLSNGSMGNIDQYFDRIMAVVIGIFLHISTTILFESSVDHHFNFKKLMAVLAGIAVALINFLLH